MMQQRVCWLLLTFNVTVQNIPRWRGPCVRTPGQKDLVPDITERWHCHKSFHGRRYKTPEQQTAGGDQL